MTSNMIYCDFRRTVTSAPASTVLITSSILGEGRKLIKTVKNINVMLNAACIFLCGACTAVSIFILLVLSGG